MDDDSIVVYLHTDAALLAERDGPRVDLVFMIPTGIDTSLVEDIRRGNTEASVEGEPLPERETVSNPDENERGDSATQQQQQPLERHMDDLIAVEKLLFHRRIKRDVDDSGIVRREGCLSKHLRTYRALLREIAHHNLTHPSPHIRIGTAAPILSNPVVTALWVRERMQAKWKMHRRQHAAVRAFLKARERAAEVRDDDTTASTTAAIAKEKRNITRRLFEECVIEELVEVEGVLAGELAHGVAELKELFALKNALRLELYGKETSLTDVIDQTSPSFGHTTSSFPFLDTQLSALSSLISIGFHTTTALETRLNRLSAKDVRDPVERSRISERRLAQPEAMMYLNKAAEDLQFVRDWSRTVIAGFQGVEGELSELARDAGQLFCELQDGLAWLEGRAAGEKELYGL